MKYLTSSLIALFCAFSWTALADGDSDHERARAAMESGEIVPLTVILEKVESLYEGSIIEVELEDEDDDDDEYGEGFSGFIYEIKLLTPQGNLLKLEFDARTTEILKIKGHGEEKARKDSQATQGEQ